MRWDARQLSDGSLAKKDILIPDIDPILSILLSERLA